jgi:uncharacterized tellurite resistance protein B-like protein
MPGLFTRLFGSRTESDIEARLIPIVHMMMVDGDMGPREMELLAAHTASIGVSAERFQRVLERVKSGGPFPLPTAPEQKLEVLAAAAAMMTVDGSIAVSELRLLHVLGASMGIPPEIFSSVMLRAVEFGQRTNPDVDVAADFSAALQVLATTM